MYINNTSNLKLLKTVRFWFDNIWIEITTFIWVFYFYTVSYLLKTFKYIFLSFSLTLFGNNRLVKSNSFFIIQNKNYKSNAEVSTHYWFICLYSENIRNKILISWESFNLLIFFRMCSTPKLSKYAALSFLR